MAKKELGFDMEDLIGDDPARLRELLARVVLTVRDDREDRIPMWQNPYNPLTHALSPHPSWSGRSLTQEYYDQRIAIYEHVLALVEEQRENFASTDMVWFRGEMRKHIEHCERYKGDLAERQARAEWIRSMQEPTVAAAFR